MALLLAELRKLRRPLTYATLAGAVLLTVFLDWAGQANSTVKYPASGTLTYGVVSCQEAHLPAGPRCDRFLSRQAATIRRSQQQARSAATLSLAGRSAAGAGRFAAGYTASLVGAAALLLIGAGHIGGEFTGRSVKSILVEDPRRWRFLLAKAMSLWLTGVALIIIDWAVLALASLRLASRYANPRLTSSTSSLLATSLDRSARALLVLAVFAVLCVLAAVLTRNVLGTLGVSLGVILASLALTQASATATWNLAYPIAQWMLFRPGDVPADYLWLIPAHHSPSTASPYIALSVLLLLLAIFCATATGWFRRADVRS